MLRLRDQGTNALVSFDITGVFTRRQGSGAANSYWNLSYIPASGMSTESGSTTYGPLIVSQAAFGTALTMSSGSWVGQPDMTAFSDSDLNPVAANLTSLSKSLPTASFLNGAQLTTSLPSVLSGADSDLVVARSVLVISALQLLVLAIAALLAVARLLAAQREGESALLVARGATRSQLTRLTAAEVVPLSALVSIAGAVAGIWLAGALASAGPLGTAGIQLAGRPGSWSDATAAALVVAVIAVAALLAPGATPSPTAARVRRGRQAMVAGVARAGLDIALVVLAVLAGWQLRQYSAASNGGTAGIDPVLALAPALALAAGSVAALRLLPLAARTTDRLAARGKGLVTSLAGWQFSRMPIRQGSAALLLIMAVAAGTLALAQHESWTRSASDQAIFATGGDVQVNLPAQLEPGGVGAVTDARGVTHSLAVAADIQASPGEMVAVDSAQAPQVARLRGDESRLPAASLFRAITPSGGLPGAVLPAPQPGARAGTIRLTAALGLHLPVSTRDSRALAAQLGPVTVTLTILDATGSAYQVAAGTLVADGLAPPARRVPWRQSGALPAAGDRDHGHVPDAPARRTIFGAHGQRPAAGRLDGRRQLACPGRLSGEPVAAAADRAARPRVSARHEPGGDVHLQLRLWARDHRRRGNAAGHSDPRAAGASSRGCPGNDDPGHRDWGVHGRERAR